MMMDASPMSADAVSTVDLSILVVNWNTRDLLCECLASIYSTIDDLKVETIVVDNGSTDGSVALVEQKFPAVRVVANASNRGFAAANNQAIHASRGRHVLLLNSDATLCPDASARMVELLDQHPQIAVVGGKLLNLDGSFQASFNDFPTLWSALIVMTGLRRWVYPSTYPSYPEDHSQSSRRVDWVGGALLAARRAAIDEVGMLDEGYFMYGEELDWCFRFCQAGWHVYYEPTVVAIHKSGGSSVRVPERRRGMIYRGQWRFLRKHHGRLAADVFRLAVLAKSAAMICVWSVLGATGSSRRRDAAWAQVRSYRYSMAHI
jgi:N-acetylglucosaminyl-diphospho-decaprenol L-rhamnosyltransferase